MMYEFPKLKDKDKEFLLESINDDTLVMSHKLDGTAAMYILEKSKLTLTGRGVLIDGTLQDYTLKFPEIVEEGILGETTCVLLGEIVTFKNGEDRFDLLQPRLTRKKDIGEFAKEFPAKFVAFDIVELNDRDLTLFPLYYRLSMLEHVCETLNIPTALQATTATTKQHLVDMMEEQDWEGVVIKDKTAVFGEDSYKFKQQFTVDCFCEGEFREGKGRNSKLVGALRCYQYINGKKTDVSYVRGFTDEQCRQFTDDIAAGIISEEHSLVLEVKHYGRILPSYKLRHASLVRIRTDKCAVQCTYEP